jgi:hypothetical protein
MALLGRLFRELQLQRCVPVRRLDDCTPNLATNRGCVRLGSDRPYRQGRYGEVALDGLNVALAVHWPGPMVEGNGSVGAYVDQRADDKQTEALGAIFTGAAGGPMASFAPLISKNLGVKKVPITYRVEGKKRFAEIPGILHMAVDPLPTMHPSGEMWASTGHPISPDRLAFAVGASGNTFSDHGMRWDNSGKNGHYAPVSWSSQ